MSQVVERFSQPEMRGANFLLRRLEAERFQEYGWQEPYESRGSLCCEFSYVMSF